MNSVPSSSGQNDLGTTPLGLNMTTNRCLRREWLAAARLGRFQISGPAAALRPRPRRKLRRVLNFGMCVLQ